MKLTTEQRNNSKEYLLTCIDVDYDVVNACGDYTELPKSKELIAKQEQPEYIIKYFFDTFYDEYKWRVSQVGEMSALIEYLMNQPAVITLPCYYHEQIELAKKFGSIPQDATEKEEQKIIDNFFKFFANYLLQFKRKFKILDSITKEHIRDKRFSDLDTYYSH